MTGDITVLGLHPTVCVLDDISMDVPHGATVVIPADKAAKSKDLWRAVSQKYLFQVKPGSSVQGGSNPMLPELELLRTKVRQLEEENRVLRAAQKNFDVERHKLDTILVLLQSGPRAVSMAVPVTMYPAIEKAAEPISGVIEMAPPPFIPSKIRADDIVQAHVQTEAGSSEGSAVSGAASKLREFRQRKTQ
jgi:hypothetical protein